MAFNNPSSRYKRIEYIMSIKEHLKRDALFSIGFNILRVFCDDVLVYEFFFDAALCSNMLCKHIICYCSVNTLSLQMNNNK